MRLLSGALGAAFLLSAAASVSAQAISGEASGPGSVSSRTAASAPDLTAMMKSALRDLVTRQESYWMAHASYTTDMSALGTYNTYSRKPVPQDSAWVQVIFAGSRGWTGIATHRGAKDKSCVIFVGPVDDLPKVPVTMEQKKIPQDQGAPLCDAM
jgi:hypothetical protein